MRRSAPNDEHKKTESEKHKTENYINHIFYHSFFYEITYENVEFSIKLANMRFY